MRGWLDHLDVERGASPHTLSSYRRDLARWTAYLQARGVTAPGDVSEGHVTDFLLVSFFPFVFNVADAAITVGGVLLAARLLLSEASLDGAPDAAPVAETE